MTIKRIREGILAVCVVIVFLCSLFAFFGCGDKSHEHNFVDGKCECEAIDSKYFIGNIFQIEVQSLGEMPISIGTGFVLNKDGWFITNSHVMENAYYANALFEIPNTEQGDSFTKLSISQAGFNNPKKDFFIGKIDNYGSIADNYRQIEFSTKYELEEVTYSVGYPSGTPYMEINKGVVVDNSTSFEGKLNGVQYIASSSYIMQGSSGGVLLNSDLDIIGITTIVSTVNGEFDRSFSISTFNFQNDVEKVPNYDLNDLATFIHPENTDYIRFFNALKNKTDMVRTEEIGGVASYAYFREEESVNGSEIAYSLSETHSFDSDFYMCISTSYYWARGDRREIYLYGYWSPTAGFDNFKYKFEYTFPNGEYYIVKSSNINYSASIDLTLNNYTTSSSYYYEITNENIVYAREQFNLAYETLLYIWTIE